MLKHYTVRLFKKLRRAQVSPLNQRHAFHRWNHYLNNILNWTWQQVRSVTVWPSVGSCPALWVHQLQGLCRHHMTTDKITPVGRDEQECFLIKWCSKKAFNIGAFVKKKHFSCQNMILWDPPTINICIKAKLQINLGKDICKVIMTCKNRKTKFCRVCICVWFSELYHSLDGIY